MEEGEIKIENEDYPRLLKEISDPPKKLYYRGHWNKNIFENCLAVVGSRRMTSYGQIAIEKIVKEVAANGVTIVSGFMYGVDATAHQAALDGGGRTIAVMPCGINIIHPAYQEKLYNDILQNGGLIISEFEGDFPPDKWTYPRRNRLVAGLSQASFVVEAAPKSGSLITARLAQKYHRKLFALPGPVTSKVSEGTNNLLKKGASLVTSSEDILRFYGRKLGRQKNTPHVSLQGLEKDLLAFLKREPMEIDELSRNFEIPVSQIGTALSLMAMKGLIIQKGRKYFPHLC